MSVVIISKEISKIIINYLYCLKDYIKEWETVMKKKLKFSIKEFMVSEYIKFKDYI